MLMCMTMCSLSPTYADHCGRKTSTCACIVKLTVKLLYTKNKEHLVQWQCILKQSKRMFIFSARGTHARINSYRLTSLSLSVFVKVLLVTRIGLVSYSQWSIAVID